jgi:hypothetical protein
MINVGVGQFSNLKLLERLLIDLCLPIGWALNLTQRAWIERLP